MIAKEGVQLIDLYRQTRRQTEKLCMPLTPEDHVVQPIVDVSPPKWHLGHTTWFFEAFVLSTHLPSYKVYNDNYNFLFNSYYESIGARVIRTDRGNMTRPGVAEILQYRSYVNEHMERFLNQGVDDKINALVTLGLQHEQQHQELLCYDIKYILGNNPLFPVYSEQNLTSNHTPSVSDFLTVEEGIYTIGHSNKAFCFDNELGVHKTFVHDYGIMDRLVTNGEYLAFILDGGYRNFRFWLSDAWEWVQQKSIKAPAYWHEQDNQWYNYSLNGGLKPIDLNAPVVHVSFYEADAFAKWKKMRLPTEYEWEIACGRHSSINTNANFVESENYEPVPQKNNNPQLYGDVWEWTNSAYLPYPYYQAPEGAVGEYNGKFMINQMVLRGGSCVTPQNHIRLTYRNFFHPNLRWMFSGIRLAKSL